jgi:hypothetical protein
MKKRITLLVVALMMALTMSFGGVAFGKQLQTFDKGKTETHQGNSEHSPVVSCHHGSPGSNGSPC